ncbi:MAG: OmpA family protein [Cellvibrio sp.]|jgi:Outer membrane protein and related peptidoglycan-associated (lipo)proteins
MKKIFTLLLASGLCFGVQANNNHPLIDAYPDATLRKQLTYDYEVFHFPSTPVDTNDHFETLEATGDLYQYFYVIKGVSSLKVYENYAAALKTLDFKVIFSCAGEDCGGERRAKALGNHLSPEQAIYNYYYKPYYLLAEKETPKGKVIGAWYIGAYEADTAVQQVILESEPLENNLIKVDASYLTAQAQATSPTESADAKELSKDHKLFARYPGATLRKHQKVDYESVNIPAAPGAQDQTPLSLTGDLARHFYVIKDTSSLKIYENYKQALSSAGFTVLSSCELNACGTDRESQQLGNKLSVEGAVYNYYRNPYYVVARKTLEDREVYVALFIGAYESEVAVQQVIVETEALVNDLIKVDADSLQQQIDATGKALIYGIYFDTGKAMVKPESKETLDAIATLLKRNSALLLYVVGHTDDTGTRESNLTLSQQRSAAVVETLVKDYGIAANRLLAQGVGPYAPAASNDNETGRQKNRRVELVKRLQ